MLVKGDPGLRHRSAIIEQELWKSLYDTVKQLYIWIPRFEQSI